MHDNSKNYVIYAQKREGLREMKIDLRADLSEAEGWRNDLFGSHPSLQLYYDQCSTIIFTDSKVSPKFNFIGLDTNILPLQEM